ncbi:MAG: LysM peptidoglycan-binding domain-containing protein [Sandaracinaceae bacterium]
MARTILALLSAGLATAGCGRELPEPPAAAAPPTVVEAAAADAPEPEPEPSVDHTLQDGESLWLVARAYGVSVADLMEVNELRPRDIRRLRPGQTLVVPGVTGPREAPPEPALPPPPAEEGGSYHHLGEGETLWDVARLYEVDLDELMRKNGLDDDAVRLLRAGRAVLVPGATAREVARKTRERAEASTQTRGFRHTVTPGETIWDLAGAFGVTTAEIMAANGLDEADAASLREGTRLYIPGVERDRGGRVRRQLTRAQRRALVRARRLGLGTRQVASALLRGRVESRWERAASQGWRRGRTPGTLRWPVTRGWFVRGYGSGEGHYHLAVDIMGRIGWNVRAAAAGIVAYAGNEVPGYGNMVLVVHPGGWVTMYAHNSTNLVVAGQRVPKGGILGEVGSTGISRGPHVHFELMHDGKNCDPAALFRPGVRHRDGHHSPIERVTWSHADDRPARVRCHPRRRHPRSRWVVHESFDDDESR